MTQTPPVRFIEDEGRQERIIFKVCGVVGLRMIEHENGPGFVLTCPSEPGVASWFLVEAGECCGDAQFFYLVTNGEVYYSLPLKTRIVGGLSVSFLIGLGLAHYAGITKRRWQRQGRFIKHQIKEYATRVFKADA